MLLLCAIPLAMDAQTSCDKLFASGVKLQQTMTVASQNKAITYFEKAKVCYDSQAKKDLCDQQIKACRNIIAQLSKKTKVSTSDSSSNGNSSNGQPTQETVQTPTSTRNVELSIDCTYLKFKGKGGEFKKANVTCNYSDWEIEDKPDWVNCTRSDSGEIVVEALKNPTKTERSGIIKITCGDKSVSLTVIQEKFKKFVVL
jgi:hypothetical protein